MPSEYIPDAVELALEVLDLLLVELDLEEEVEDEVDEVLVIMLVDMVDVVDMVMVVMALVELAVAVTPVFTVNCSL